MVKIGLQIKVDMEFVEKLYTCHPEFQWFLKIKCSNCGEVADKWQVITESEKVPLKHNKSETNFLVKCKLCSRENSMDIVEGSNRPYIDEDSSGFQTIVAFECRGVEPVEFSPRDGWMADAKDNGAKFTNIDLTEKEWADYDDKNNVSVGIYEFQSQFIKLK